MHGRHREQHLCVLNGHATNKNRPYDSKICDIDFGGEGSASIHYRFLDGCPKIRKFFDKSNFGYHYDHTRLVGSVDNVSLDVGHVLVHFLVSGNYKCFKPKGDAVVERNKFELTTALRVRMAADRFQLKTLGELAKAEMERIGGGMTLPSILQIMEEVGASPPQSPMAAAYLVSRVQGLYRDLTLPSVGQVLGEIDAPGTISGLLLKSIIELKREELARKEEGACAQTQRPVDAAAAGQAEAACEADGDVAAELAEPGELTCPRGQREK